MAIPKSNSPVDMGTASNVLPADPPRMEEELLRKFPEDLRKFDRELHDYLLSMVQTLQRLHREESKPGLPTLTAGRGAPAGTPPLGSGYTDTTTGDWWTYTKAGWRNHS